MTEIREVFEEKGRETEFEIGQKLLSPFEPVRRCVLLTHGLAKRTIVSEDGRRRTLSFYGADRIVGVETIPSGTTPRHGDVVSVFHSKGIAVAAEEISRVCRDDPAFARKVMGEIAHQLEMQLRIKAWSLFPSAEARLSQFFLRFVDVSQRSDGFVPLAVRWRQKDLAEAIGVSRAHAAMMIQRLERKGALRRPCKGKILVRPPSLAQIVDEVDVVPIRRIELPWMG